MIIDIHTHAPWKKLPGGVSTLDTQNTVNRPGQETKWIKGWDEYLEAMESVDHAVCFNMCGDPRPGAKRGHWLAAVPARVVNDNTAAFVQAHPAKFTGFLSVHPHDPEMAAEITRATEELGLRGIKLGPNYQNFDPVGPEAFRLYERAQEIGLPVLFHQGTSPNQFADLDYAHPRHMDRVAISFPELRIVMAHMGHPWQIDCITVIRKHPNVYADISGLFYRPWSWYQCMLQATEWGVLHKLLFASDYAVATPAEAAEGCRRVNEPARAAGLPLVPEAEVEAIIHRDSLRLLGLR